MSLHYPHTAAEIGETLGLTAHEVGNLLGHNGLNWAGDPAYQEMGRHKAGRQKFWHYSVPDKLRELLTAPPVEKMRTANKRVRAYLLIPPPVGAHVA